MHASPRISVIMPVYNAARFLREAAQSILDQTFSDFELIAVDDGSTDDSAAVLNEIAANDDRVRVLSRPNTGIVGALNDGISLARGELLARMDADDIAMLSRFERQVAFLDAHPECVLIGASVVIVDEEGNEIDLDEAPTGHEKIEEQLLNGCGAVCHPTVMMRAEAVRRVGQYREQYRFEDMDLFLRLGEVGQLANISEPLLRYRWHLESICHRTNTPNAARARAAMLREAYGRRGILDRVTPIPSLDVVEINENVLRIEHYHRWSYVAAKAGRFRVARKYALAGWRLDPCRKKSWWILGASLVGIGVAARLTRYFRIIRFWRRPSALR